jgi:hypothetical protein
MRVRSNVSKSRPDGRIASIGRGSAGVNSPE